MRAVIQRVHKARVLVEGEIVGEIGKGLLVFLGAGKGDGEADIEYLAEKVAGLRIFEDSEGKMNFSVADIKGGVLVVSQFTLFGDCRKGKRPSFTDALEPDLANKYYEIFIQKLTERNINVASGRFQAKMSVELSNDGPVTILLDSKKVF